MSACVSPPHESVSHIVEVAAIIAHAASTALPPFWKTSAPAVAARGFPVIAIQFFPCSTGFAVRCARMFDGAISTAAINIKRTTRDNLLRVRMFPPFQVNGSRQAGPVLKSPQGIEAIAGGKRERVSARAPPPAYDEETSRP